MADHELIEALRHGRNDAWQELVTRYVRLVFHVMRRTLSVYGREVSTSDVEDLTFELFHSLVRDNYRILGTIGEPFDLKAWLAISARRRAIDFIRRKRLTTRSIDTEMGEEDLKLSDVIPERPSAPAAQETAETQGIVQEALEALNSKERMVVRLFYLKSKKYREIARITGINPNSISPTLMRAVGKMHKFLAERSL